MRLVLDWSAARMQSMRVNKAETSSSELVYRRETVKVVERPMSDLVTEDLLVE